MPTVLPQGGGGVFFAVVYLQYSDCQVGRWVGEWLGKWVGESSAPVIFYYSLLLLFFLLMVPGENACFFFFPFPFSFFVLLHIYYVFISIFRPCLVSFSTKRASCFVQKTAGSSCPPSRCYRGTLHLWLFSVRLSFQPVATTNCSDNDSSIAT